MSKTFRGEYTILASKVYSVMFGSPRAWYSMGQEHNTYLGVAGFTLFLVG
jgi:hypothetical protein